MLSWLQLISSRYHEGVMAIRREISELERRLLLEVDAGSKEKMTTELRLLREFTSTSLMEKIKQVKPKTDS